MSILCAGMCYLGYISSDRPLLAMHWEFDEHRLLLVSGFLSVIGAFFYFQISRLSDDLTVMRQWTGLPVMYLFFAQLHKYGFTVALLLYVKNRSKTALAIVLFDSLFIIDWIVIRGRRSMLIEFALIILCVFWFVRRKSLPRWGIPVALVLGTLAVFGASSYRAAVYQGQAYGGTLQHAVPWEEVLQVDFVDVFQKSIQEECWEVRNMVYRINSYDASGDFNGGIAYWDELVFAYVPAQLVGAEFKEALMTNIAEEETDPPDPASPPGATSTGMADSFKAFWYFGCFVFFLIARVCRKFFEAARAGHVAAQLVYMLTITSAMHAITHHTKLFVTPWVHLALFLLPCLLWARKRSPVTELVPRR